MTWDQPLAAGFGQGGFGHGRAMGRACSSSKNPGEVVLPETSARDLPWLQGPYGAAMHR